MLTQNPSRQREEKFTTYYSVRINFVKKIFLPLYYYLSQKKILSYLRSLKACQLFAEYIQLT